MFAIFIKKLLAQAELPCDSVPDVIISNIYNGLATMLQEAQAEALELVPEPQDEEVIFLRDLAERMRRVPVMYGVDETDIDMLLEIASGIEKVNGVS